MPERHHEFIVYGVPQPQGSKKLLTPKGRRPVMVDDNRATLRSWRAETVAAAQLGWDGPPMDGPLLLEARFVFPRPTGARKAARLKSTKPDLDKLVRALCDALTAARVIRDDARVSVLRCQKLLADAEGSMSIGATVRVTALNEGGSLS